MSSEEILPVGGGGGAECTHSFLGDQRRFVAESGDSDVDWWFMA